MILLIVNFDGCHNENQACNLKAAPFNVNNFQAGELIFWRDECSLGNLLVGGGVLHAHPSRPTDN
jgi:hypothetical protein